MKHILLSLLFITLSTTAWAKPWVVAHRGGTALGPENRLQTFQAAVKLGVDALELDIHQSQDGHLVVIHDRSLKRTFGIDKLVDQMTLAELQAVGVPTLQQVVDIASGHCGLVIEVKQPKDGTRHRGIERRVVDFLARNRLTEETIIISFYRDSLVRFHHLEPKLQLGFLFGRPIWSLSQAKSEMGLSYLGPYHKLVTPNFVKKAQKLGLKVNPWTVNEVAQMKKLSELGVDAMTTNHPAELQRLVRAKE